MSFTKLLVKEFFIREELPFSSIFYPGRASFLFDFSLQFFATIFVDVRYPIDSNDHYPTKMLPAHRTSKKFVFGKIEVDIELDVILTLLLDFQ